MHGDVIAVLDKVRSAGITKVGYDIRAAGAQPGAQPPVLHRLRRHPAPSPRLRRRESVVQLAICESPLPGR